MKTSLKFHQQGGNNTNKSAEINHYEEISYLVYNLVFIMISVGSFQIIYACARYYFWAIELVIGFLLYLLFHRWIFYPKYYLQYIFQGYLPAVCEENLSFSSVPLGNYFQDSRAILDFMSPIASIATPPLE